MTDRVHLLISDRDFITSRDTLIQESEYFRALLSDKYESKDSCGKYFVDGDPDLFQDILRYLRRGIYPLYWTRSEGHNYARYLALSEEAKYFQIDRLAQWLDDEKYLLAVTVKMSATVFKGLEAIKDGLKDTVDKMDTNTEYVSYTHIDKIYICPRGIGLHRGDPSRCGRQCANAQGESYTFEDEVTLVVCKLDKKLCIDRKICKDSYEDTTKKCYIDTNL